MHYLLRIILSGTFLVVSYSSAQQIEYMVPIGFNNPFLKSGQYISTIYFKTLNSKSESKGDRSGYESDEYSINTHSYIGLTDRLTLSAGIYVYPKQTVRKGLYGSGGDMRNNLYVRPEFILSFRPENNFEIFGSINFSDYSTSFKESTYVSEVPVGMDEFGNIIYEEQTLISPALPDRNYNFKQIKVGLTYSGSLW